MPLTTLAASPNSPHSTVVMSEAAKLTVLIPCKNERRNIRACIDSLNGLADEILVADSGSSDGTLAIIRSISGCRIIEREYVDHGNFVNWALPQASHEWVFVIDADERMTPRLASGIRAALDTRRDGVDAYWVRFKCFFMGHPLRFSRWNTPALRLVRRDKCRNGECRVHPEFEVPRNRTRRLPGALDHYSFWDYDTYFRKYLDYTQRAANDRWEAGKRVSYTGLLLRPMLRFVYLYFLRLGALDGLPGLQVCMLTAYFNTFVKQARLWEREHAIPQPDPEQATTEGGVASPRKRAAA